MKSDLSKLLEGVRETLTAGLALLESVDDQRYAARPLILETDSAGNHMRHCLEFFECFFAGLGDGSVDYAARKRDSAIARNRLLPVSRRETGRGFGVFASLRSNSAQCT